MEPKNEQRKVLLADALAHPGFMTARWVQVEQVENGRFRHDIRPAGLLYQIDVKLFDAHNNRVEADPSYASFQLSYSGGFYYIQGPVSALDVNDAGWYVFSIARPYDAATECINTTTIAYLRYFMDGLPVETDKAVIIERRLYPVAMEPNAALSVLDRAA